MTMIPPDEAEWAGSAPGRVVKSEAVRRENKYVTCSKEERAIRNKVRLGEGKSFRTEHETEVGV